MSKVALFASLAVAALGAARAEGSEPEIGLRPGGPTIGAAVLLGGGVESFSRAGARGVTDTGGFWSARLAWGLRQLVGVEAAYIGSAQTIDALGMSNTAWLVSNGAEAVARLNAPVERGQMLFEPYVLGGVGWRLYQVERSAATADVAATDNVLQVPFGGGFAFGYYSFMVDARFTYRATFFNDLFRTTNTPLDSWSMGALVGIQF